MLFPTFICLCGLEAAIHRTLWKQGFTQKKIEAFSRFYNCTRQTIHFLVSTTLTITFFLLFYLLITKLSGIIIARKLTTSSVMSPSPLSLSLELSTSAFRSKDVVNLSPLILFLSSIEIFFPPFINSVDSLRILFTSRLVFSVGSLRFSFKIELDLYFEEDVVVSMDGLGGRPNSDDDRKVPAM